MKFFSEPWATLDNRDPRAQMERKDHLESLETLATLEAKAFATTALLPGWHLDINFFLFIYQNFYHKVFGSPRLYAFGVQ